ncbi:MAG: diguanylate cyclase [Synergistaceae bacterium]|nr:diguanylate cyclase [Synergistaceae bacterium]
MPKIAGNLTDEKVEGTAAGMPFISDELMRFVKDLNEIAFVVDMNRVIVAASGVALQLLDIPGYADGEILIDDFLPKIYLDAIFSRIKADGIKKTPITFPVRGADGREILLETRFNWSRAGDSDVVLMTCRDINAYSETISDLTEREDRYRTIFHESPLGFIHVNSDGYITDCNSAFLKIFGFERFDVINVCLAEENTLRVYQRFKRSAMDAVIGVSSRHESQFQNSEDGRAGWVRVAFSPVRSDNKVFLGAIGIVEDITETKRAMEEISFVSSHDDLTGLYNRAACENALILFDKPECFPLSIIYADLNCLKLANDAFGHHEGDKLLRSISTILKENIGEGGFAYRWGGDEFIILLRHTDLDLVTERVNAIRDVCARWKGEGLVHPSVALGYATKSFVEQDVHEVMKAAEDEMYANKLHDGKAVRQAILAELEVRFHDMMDGAVGKRCRRMNQWAQWVSENMNLGCDVEEFRLLCRYHDIGLLASSDELDIIRADQSRDRVAPPMQHMAVGYRITRSIAEISSAAENILAHHEWWDGMGYPNQLSGEDIPYAARLMSILDAVEGMTALALPGDLETLGDALESVKSCAGRQFDPTLVDEFMCKLLEAPPEFIGDMED